MEVIKGAPEAPKPNRSIDYTALATAYNQLKPQDLIKLDEPVSNITLFKRTLEARNVIHGVDFRAFNQNGVTYVERISEAQMEG